jgi:hypothetical protein
MAVLETPLTLTTFNRPEAGGYIGYFLIKSVLTTFTPHYCRGRSIKGSVYTFVLDVDAVLPLTGEYKANHYYYVRDNLVDTYKANSNWSTLASHILPMSQLPTQ